MKKEREVNTVNLTLKMYFDKSEGMLSPWNILEVGVWVSILTVLTVDQDAGKLRAGLIEL